MKNYADQKSKHQTVESPRHRYFRLKRLMRCPLITIGGKEGEKMSLGRTIVCRQHTRRLARIMEIMGVVVIDSFYIVAYPSL